MCRSIEPKRVVLLLVGSLNPPTNLHLRLFELARDSLEKRKLYSVVGGLLSPVHDSYGKKGLISAVHRCKMTKLAVQTSDWLFSSDWETRQEGWSRTIVSLKYHKDTLNSNSDSTSLPDWAAEIQSRVRKAANDGQLSNIDLKLLCGADLLESFSVPGLWKDEDIENIVRNYGLVIITRAGSNPERFIYESDLLTKLQDEIHIVPEWISNEISSTKIRRAVSRDESVKYLVQDSVLEYMKAHKLYSSSLN